MVFRKILLRSLNKIVQDIAIAMSFHDFVQASLPYFPEIPFLHAISGLTPKLPLNTRDSSECVYFLMREKSMCFFFPHNPRYPAQNNGKIGFRTQNYEKNLISALDLARILHEGAPI